ncbi:oxidoreductase family protein [Macroventuria anomochaeta]|uniref:Oxidoreductase family protein n=1 Tax=Macroventuria anomochaeta TaxID=301207 RepID=A0ACB6S7D3_9PLEO|nr:oxidoreductase family protein [Macroventuria anomochaeta]KAF2629124.1 oxidoreductase family protein [Macroventuria anomochaeta]
MAPIRVALVGLSASAKVTWAADAHLPYLLSTRGKERYELVALLNSSVEAAETAKTTFKLSKDVKAYGDPSKLAADPDIDLVVVNTRADVHFPVVEPSVRAGKGVFIEWPLTENFAKAVELTRGQPYPNSIIGLQGRVAPLTLRLKEILATGVIGKVLNSEVRTYGNLMPRDSVPERLTYFADRKVGGHPINIYYGHLIDFVHEVLGDWQDFHALGQIQRPSLKVVGANGQDAGSVKSDVPDFLSVHGTLQNNKGVVAPGATLLATFRLGPQFKDEPGLVWTINGEKGELRLAAPGPYLQSGYSFDGPITIVHHEHATDKLTELGWDWPDWQKDYGLRARSAAELYERYAEWVENGCPDTVPKERQWPRLDDGVALLREFDKLYKQIDADW